MKNRILVVTAAVMICLTGCASDGDFISEVGKKNNPGFYVNTSLELEIRDEGKKNSPVAAQKLYDVLVTTDFKDYVEFDEGYFTLDTASILEKYCEENGIEAVELTKEEKFRLFYSNEERYWDGYNWVHKDGFMYLANKEGKPVKTFCYVFLSQSDDVKEKMQEEELKPIFAQMEYLDQKVMDKNSKYPNMFPDIDIPCMDCGVAIKWGRISIGYTYCYIQEGIEYLTKFNKRDAWVNMQGTCSDSVDTLTMMYYISDTEAIIRLDLFGDGKELKEIKITCNNSLDSIPENGKYTVINCLTAMGMDKETAENVIDKLPSDNGETESIKHIVKSANKNNKCIKFFR